MDLEKIKALLEARQQRLNTDAPTDNPAPEAKKPPVEDDDRDEQEELAPDDAKSSEDKDNRPGNEELPTIKGSRTLSGEQANKVEVEPDLYPEEIKEGRTAVVTFGRFNPPTLGHQMLVGLVEHHAKNVRGMPLVYLSRSHDAKKNPMMYESKLEYAQFAFGECVRETPADCNDLISLVTRLSEHFDNLVFVAGSDRVAEYARKLNKYNGDLYEFDHIAVVSSGDRDPDATDVAGVSASKLRWMAEEGSFDEFKNGLATPLRCFAEEIYHEVRGELHELNTQQRAKRAITFRRNKIRVQLGRDRAMKRRAPSAQLVKRSRRLAIKMIRKRILRGQNYNDLTYAQRSIVDQRLKKRKKSIGKIAKRLLPKVARAEASRKLGGRFMNPMSSHSVNESVLFEMVHFLPEAEHQYELTQKEVQALQEKADRYGTTYEILETVFRRGIAMWENVETDMQFNQYAFARVNSFLNGGKAYDVDFDLVVEDCDNFLLDKEDGGKVTDIKNRLTPAERLHRLKQRRKIHEDAMKVPNLDDGMGKRRCDMPQLTNFDAFHKDLTDAGHSLSHDFVKPDTLTPTQKHFNQEKVDKLKANGWGDKGIIISQDDHVIDGHHRWLAAHQKGEKIKARRTSLKADDLLDFVKGKPYVEKKKLNEGEE